MASRLTSTDRTSLPGLDAAGECACTGIHGANRLASDSLTECFVFGQRAAEAGTKERRTARPPATPTWRFDPPTPATREAVWRLAGPTRHETRLTQLTTDHIRWRGHRRDSTGAA